ncbi:hypothetical protein [Pseudalkalibacillus sp. SCS-8]|uniref:hypothetical protein n=1 Tax=Pseudalkalibacillus nanhaiensis TaxID=3115291 RepID=UPI0032DBE70B
MKKWGCFVSILLMTTGCSLGNVKEDVANQKNRNPLCAAIDDCFTYLNEATQNQLVVIEANAIPEDRSNDKDYQSFVKKSLERLRDYHIQLEQAKKYGLNSEELLKTIEDIIETDPNQAEEMSLTAVLTDQYNTVEPERFNAFQDTLTAYSKAYFLLFDHHRNYIYSEEEDFLATIKEIEQEISKLKKEIDQELEAVLLADGKKDKSKNDTQEKPEKSTAEKASSEKKVVEKKKEPETKKQEPKKTQPPINEDNITFEFLAKEGNTDYRLLVYAIKEGIHREENGWAGADAGDLITHGKYKLILVNLATDEQLDQLIIGTHEFNLNRNDVRMLSNRWLLISSVESSNVRSGNLYHIQNGKIQAVRNVDSEYGELYFVENGIKVFDDSLIQTFNYSNADGTWYIDDFRYHSPSETLSVESYHQIASPTGNQIYDQWVNDPSYYYYEG